MADLYLRDLNDDSIADFIRTWEREGKTKLLKAFRNGDDIKIGSFCKQPVVV